MAVRDLPFGRIVTGKNRFQSFRIDSAAIVPNFKNRLLIEAEFLGYMLSANTNINVSEEYVEYITENEFNIERIYKILFNLGLEYEPEVRGKVFVAKIQKNEKLYSYLVLKQDLSDDMKKAVVKGCFLGSGSVNNPEKQNHLEVCFWGKDSLEYVNNICRGNSNPRPTGRGLLFSLQILFTINFNSIAHKLSRSVGMSINIIPEIVETIKRVK